LLGASASGFHSPSRCAPSRVVHGAASLRRIADMPKPFTQMRVRWGQLHDQWHTLTFYQRFESTIALILTLVITVVIAVALYRLVVEVMVALVLGVLDPLEHAVFQSVFGGIMTVLIALEFNHTLLYVASREQSVIQTKIVLLIALLALARKFIVLDLHTTGPLEVLALGAVTLALGVTYWLMRERDDRVRRETLARDEDVRPHPPR
jgi:uncharacterized membrane protein (DUF373 family)